MARTGVTLKSMLRSNVVNGYRSRGKSNNNLWLAYSVKNNQEYLLTSDREFIHWIYFLESNPDVESYDLDPEPITSHDEIESRETILDAHVFYRDGRVEWHEVKAGSKNKSELSRLSQLIAQVAAASNQNIKYVIFNDDDLKPVAQVALRWLKALNYADAIKEYEHILCQNKIVEYMDNHPYGVVRDIINDIGPFDQAVIFGVITRLAIRNIMSLDLKPFSYGFMTPWKYLNVRS